MTDSIHLSIVATSRNDNHGKNLLYRMQSFLDGLVHQVGKHQISTELILVEWNPPENSPSLEKILQIPSNHPFLTIRIIQVPSELHSSLENSDKIPLFQMIAKNVGIRRARGKFILATNVDILFSDRLMQFIKNKLDSKYLYRADRLDIPEQLPATQSWEEILDFCHKNYFRINSQFKTKNIARKSQLTIQQQNSRQTIEFSFHKCIDAIRLSIQTTLHSIYQLIFSTSVSQILSNLQKVLPYLKYLIKRHVLSLGPTISCALHTNACGDFTLLSAKNWSQLRGYPEWAIFSWHIDAILLLQARQHKIPSHNLPLNKPIYHIEHEIGSGYSEKGASFLFERLKTKNIPYIDDKKLSQIRKDLYKLSDPVVYNSSNWGFGNIELPEFKS